MKFVEFPLYNAIHDVYVNFEKIHWKPHSADWLIYHEKRNQLTKLISEIIGDNVFTEERILKAWDDFGKNKEKYKLIISVANTFGHHCFYQNRNKGKCSNIMCVERSVKAENCVIVCKRHLVDHR